ncbi:MAG: hypothetical protein IKH30_08185 [Clostridia bacterium]|nr:hypothetical protein [Clostridia bacterium]
MFAYCLFCETQKCKFVAFSLEQRGIQKSFSPQIIRRQRVKGKNIDAMYDLLPGYVFAYSETEISDNRVFHGISGIIRRLGDPECNFALMDSDYDFAINLYRKNGVVGQVTVFKVGDEVKLDDPLFNNCQGKITKIDYRKQRARVDYQFGGMNCFTWVACDLISNPSR